MVSGTGSSGVAGRVGTGRWMGSRGAGALPGMAPPSIAGAMRARRSGSAEVAAVRLFLSPTIDSVVEG